ncbi:adenylosuccinate lyase, partial [bacterium]|nr:adenylosuccinate lyase [bacterium]
MIERYSKAEMTQLFSERSRWLYCLRVELAAAEEMVKRGWIPRTEAPRLLAGLRKLKKSGGPSPKRIRAVEAKVHHDVIAFVSVVASEVGAPGRWVHFGLTSSDVLDTAMALQLRDALALILGQMDRLISALKVRARETSNLPCVGRTHGMHAEASVFGLKFLSFFEEAKRNRVRLEHALNGLGYGKLSGAVGAYAHLDPVFENSVMKRLGLAVEPVSTQVIP